MTQQGDTTNIETLVDQLTLAEQVSLLSGEDFWSLPAIDRLGLGKLRVTDGPNGARGGGSLFGGVTAAAFPVGISIGASWNPDLAYEIGSAIADEVKSKGAHVSLAPTVNIHRSVTNGRNFECYSEDPELTAALTVGYIKGLQDKNISATLKHFAGNESEIERTTMSSDVDERSLREVYLRPFEDAVKKAGTWGIMSSYNRLNGTFTSEHPWLLTDVLRDEWGYDGIVMSDWFGSHTTAETVNAGLDLEMPGPTRDRGDKLIEAVENGEVSRDMIRTRALNILRLMQRTGALYDTRPFEEHADDRPEHRALIRRAGAEGTVLLKNNGLLPLAADGTVAVIGPNAKTAQIMGGGSAQLNPHYSVSPYQGIVSKLGEASVSYATGCTNHRWEPMLSGEFDIAFFDNTTLSGTPVHTGTQQDAMGFFVPPIAEGKVRPDHFSARMTKTITPEVSGTYQLGAHGAAYLRVFVDGKLIVDLSEQNWTKGRTFFEEGCDHLTGEVTLTAGQDHKIEIELQTKNAAHLQFTAFYVGLGLPMTDDDIAQAAQVAAQADTAIVFVGRSGEWDTEGSDLLDITLPGRQDELVRAVADQNQRTIVVLQTGGPVEMPWLSDVAGVLQAWYPGQEAGNAIADVLFGDVEPTGRLPQTFPLRWADNPTHSQDPVVYPGHDGHVRYDEGVFIGYRHYDRHQVTPMFPFGFGLGYTTFDLSDITATVHDTGISVSVALTNTGDRDGTGVVQLYVGDDEASVERPARELRGFAKCHVPAGETKTVQIALSPRDFAFFDVDHGLWRIEAGTFTLSAGLSAADIRCDTRVALDAAEISPSA